MFNAAHSAQRGLLIHDIIVKLRHDGCGGRTGRAELLGGIEGVSTRPVRKIVLREGVRRGSGRRFGGRRRSPTLQTPLLTPDPEQSGSCHNAEPVSPRRGRQGVSAPGSGMHAVHTDLPD